MFILFGLPNSRETSRLGITVTRRVGGAVQRNRIKRILREVFRSHLPDLVPPLDVVVNPKPGFERLPIDEVEREFLARFLDLAKRFRS